MTSQVAARITTLDRWIEYGRVIVFVMVFLILIVSYLILGLVIDTSSKQFYKKAPPIIAYCFIGMFFILGVVSYVLFRRMKT